MYLRHLVYCFGRTVQVLQTLEGCNMKYVFAGIVLCIILIYAVARARSMVTGKQSHNLAMFDIAICGVLLFLGVGFVIFSLIWDVLKTLSILIR